MKNVTVAAVLMAISLTPMISLAEPQTHEISPQHGIPSTDRVDRLLLFEGRKKTYDGTIPATDRGTILATCHDHEVIEVNCNSTAFSHRSRSKSTPLIEVRDLESLRGWGGRWMLCDRTGFSISPDSRVLREISPC
jgi:hypothetical protein